MYPVADIVIDPRRPQTRLGQRPDLRITYVLAYAPNRRMVVVKGLGENIIGLAFYNGSEADAAQLYPSELICVSLNEVFADKSIYEARKLYNEYHRTMSMLPGNLDVTGVCNIRDYLEVMVQTDGEPIDYDNMTYTQSYILGEAEEILSWGHETSLGHWAYVTFLGLSNNSICFISGSGQDGEYFGNLRLVDRETIEPEALASEEALIQRLGEIRSRYGNTHAREDLEYTATLIRAHHKRTLEGEKS